MPLVMGAASGWAGSEGEYRSEDTVLPGDESMSSVDRRNCAMVSRCCGMTLCSN